MDKGDRVEADSASARGRSQKRSSVVAGPEEAGSGGEHVKCAARPGLALAVSCMALENGSSLYRTCRPCPHHSTTLSMPSKH